jgi:hypothetical protein
VPSRPSKSPIFSEHSNHVEQMLTNKYIIINPSSLFAIRLSTETPPILFQNHLKRRASWNPFYQVIMAIIPIPSKEVTVRNSD